MISVDSGGGARLVLYGLSSLLLGLAGACAVGDEPPTTPVPQATQPQPAGSAESLPSVTLSRAFPRLTFSRPVFVTHAGDGSDRLFVLEQRGRIRMFRPRTTCLPSKQRATET